jgi:hypothetical protein
MGRTFIRALLVPLSLVSLMACEPDTSSPASSSGGPAPTLTGEAPPGSYVYEDLGLQAVLELNGSEGSLEVANGTGSELGAPAPYALAADDGRRIPIDMTDTVPIDDGATATFQVSLSEDVEIGIAVLVFGDDEFGAMTPAVDA